MIAADCAREHDLAALNNLLLEDRSVAQQDSKEASPEGSQDSCDISEVSCACFCADMVKNKKQSGYKKNPPLQFSLRSRNTLEVAQEGRRRRLMCSGGLSSGPSGGTARCLQINSQVFGPFVAAGDHPGSPWQTNYYVSIRLKVRLVFGSVSHITPQGGGS